MNKAMMRQHIGILGGMGPAAGLFFAHKLVELNCDASMDADHASFFLYSDPAIPSRVQAYLHAGASPAGAMASSLNKLSDMGADFGVVVCNTAHIYFDEIEPQVAMPLINMVANVAQSVTHEAPGTSIGLLATSATVSSGLYQRHFDGGTNVIVIPKPADQALVSAAIFDPEFGIKATKTTVSLRAQTIMEEVANRMRHEHGISHLLLGCTELSMAVHERNWRGFAIVDPVTCLARTCLERLGYSTPV